MKVSTKGRYALRMLLDLASHQEDGYVSLKEISERQTLSKKYLEQIVPVLTRGGLLLANRGHAGGYKLAKEPKDCSVGEILRLTEGNLAPVSCLADTKHACERKNACVTRPVWEGFYEVICTYLDSLSLEDILKQNIKRRN